MWNVMEEDLGNLQRGAVFLGAIFTNFMANRGWFLFDRVIKADIAVL
jgi:hypothetical protein